MTAPRCDREALYTHEGEVHKVPAHVFDRFAARAAEACPEGGHRAAALVHLLLVAWCEGRRGM